MRRVLCVGAGPEQVDSIRIARSMDLHVVAVDRDADASGMAVADTAAAVDIVDEAAVIEIAKAHDVCLVIPAPIGRLLTTVGAVNDALGLRGISRQAAVHCADKVVFNELMKAAGVGVADQHRPVTSNEVRAAVDLVGLPCIVKPRFGAGSRDVAMWREHSDVEEFIRGWDGAHEPEDELLVESWLEGVEYGVDGYVDQGVFRLIMVRRKTLTAPPYRQELIYEAPAPLDYDVTSQIAQALSSAVIAAGLQDCFVQADVALSRVGGPYIIEMAGRPAGLHLMTRMIPAVTGVDVIREGISVGLGLKRFPTIVALRAAVLYFLPLPAGVVTRFDSDPLKANLPNCIDFSFPLSVGKRLTPVRCASDVLERGYVVTVGDSIEEAMAVAEAIISEMKIEVRDDS